MSRVKVGCCGFPKGKKAYFRQFKLAEIQQTFYKPPSVEIVKKWRYILFNNLTTYDDALRFIELAKGR